MFSIEEVGCSEASSLEESEIFNISTGRELESRGRGLHDTFKNTLICYKQRYKRENIVKGLHDKISYLLTVTHFL